MHWLNMIRKFPVILAALTLTLASAGYSQVRISGQLYAMTYGLEDAASNPQWDYFQGVNLRIRPAMMPGVSFRTHFRLARRGDPADWNERVYNAYVDLKNKARNLSLRAGRQFMYRGVITGSVDGVTITGKVARNLDVLLLGGTSVPWNRSLDLVSWDDGGVLGGYAAYRFNKGPRVDASYFQRRGSGRTVWQQAGAGVAGVYRKEFYYQAQTEFNLKTSDVQSMRFRLSYQPEHWSVSGEFNSQKPRVYEDSFFNIFELNAFNQIRIGTAYRTPDYQVGVRVVHTIYSENAESEDEVFLTADTRFGSAGVVFQNGYGGDNVGVFGHLKADITDKLSGQIGSSYFNYQRRSISVADDATAFTAGLRYRPVRDLLLVADLQESLNRIYDNDLRLLIRISYLFDTR